VGIIISNRKTNKPQHLCTLCDGNPQCVKYCPGKALSHIKVETGRKFYGMSPEQIAMELIESWYGIKT
jgi:Fe-S-cluster-containing hydrogenase component 2